MGSAGKIVAAILIVSVVVFVIMFVATIGSNVGHNNYCEDWYNSLVAKQNQQGLGELFTGELAAEGDEYNRQCAS